MITDYSFTCWDFAQTIFEYLWKIISISYIDIVKRRSKLQGNSFISKSKLVNIETLKEGIKSSHWSFLDTSNYFSSCKETPKLKRKKTLNDYLL